MNDRMTGLGPLRHALVVWLAAAASIASAVTPLDAPITYVPGELVVLTPSVLVGEAARVEVAIFGGADFPLDLRWGDGAISTVSNQPQPARYVLEHAYASPGPKRLELYEAFMLVQDATIEVRAPRLRLDSGSVDVGERLMVEVESAPVGGTLDWGDGTRTPLDGGDVTVEHTYASVGSYALRVEDALGNALDVAVVTVRGAGSALAARLSLPGAVAVGAALDGAVVASALLADGDVSVDWGDGTVEAVRADGRLRHTYLRTGSFLVRLLAAGDGAVVDVALVAVGVDGTLRLDGTATLFEPTRWSASRLGPGLAYELDLGDGTVVVGVADAFGELRVEHVYRTVVSEVEATLTLLTGARRELVERARADLALPPGAERLSLSARPDVASGGFLIEARADGLLDGIDYVVAAPAIGRWTLDDAGGGGELATMAADGATIEAALLAVVPSPLGGALEVERADAEVVLAWPRGEEALTRVAADAPDLVGGLVTVEASGLLPGYRYELWLDGDPARAFRLDRADGDAWRVGVPLVRPGPLELTLAVRYPLGGTFGAAEERARLVLDVVAPTGSLALPEPVVPYAVPSPVLVRGLTPGLPYRLAIEGVVIARIDAAGAVEGSTIDPATGEAVAGGAVVDGGVDLAHPFRSTARLDLLVDVAGFDREPVASVAAQGVTFAARLGYRYDLQRYLDDGTVTIELRGAAAGFEHVLTLADGRRVVARTDERGAVDVDVTDPGFELFAAVLALDDEFFVGRLRLDDLPPRVLSFHGTDNWLVRVTSLEGPFEGRASRASMSGTGVLESFVVGGRLQDGVPMRFEGLDVLFGGTVRSGHAELDGPWTLQLPQAVRGVHAVLDELRLGPLATRPDLRGRVTLPTGEDARFERVMMPGIGAGDGFMIPVRVRGPGLDLGGVGVRLRSGGFAMVDLSTEANYNLRRSDGRTSLEHAYDAYDEVGRPSPLASLGSRWVGIVYPDAQLVAGTGDAATVFDGDAAWTAAGVSAYLGTPLGGPDGTLALGGWTFEDVAGLELLVVDSQVLRFTRPSGTVRLDWFGQRVPVAFTPAWHGWAVTTLAPIAQDYGSTAVVGGLGSFVRTGPDRLSLRFPNALWALDGDLAAEPASVDGSDGERLLANLPDAALVSEDIQTLYADSVATVETALNLYRLQLLLRDLTLHPDGSVDLGGAPWRTLARVPALDMFGFPYLGLGAEIGVQRDGDGSYRIGLRGDLKLGELIEANAAPSWFVHRDGRQTQWRFEGVGAKFGDFEDSPVTFSLVVGGVIDLERSSLSFTGGGSLTIPEVISVDALALFGVVGYDTPAPDFFFYVGAAVDLGQMERPINVKVNGIDVMAFYVFRGGIASRLRIDVGGGDCRIDDGNVAEARLPSIAANALDCYDPNLQLSLQAGTVIGSPAPEGTPSDAYGKLWHVDADLVVNLGRGGDLQIAGRGWMGKHLGEGYRQRGLAAEQLAARLVINGDGIVGSMCAGPLTSAAGVLDCSGLQSAEIRVAGVLLVELKGAIELKASWASRQYYLALGTMLNPVSIYVIPKYVQGYFITGYIADPFILDWRVRLPAAGVWVGAETGFRYDYEKSGDFRLCSYHVYAGATFGYGGSLGLQVVPSFQIDAAVVIHASARAGGRVCGKGLDVSASLLARGSLRAPNPTQFQGSMEVKIKLPVVPDIDVTVPNVRLALR